MERTAPEVNELVAERLTPEIVAEARSLFGSCFVSATFGGMGFGHTTDREVAEKLTEGWDLGTYDDEGVERMLRISCVGEGSHRYSRDEDAATFYCFRVPPALVALVREIIDEKRAA